MSDTLAERFWAKVDRRGDDECWPWLGALMTVGYGKLSAGGHQGRSLGAHRVAWELAHGAIPHGMYVLHDCDNRVCVNAAHLRLGTQRDNIRDMLNKGRGQFGPNREPDPVRWRPAPPRSQFCKRGHDLREPENRYVSDDAVRCRRCISDQGRARGAICCGRWIRNIDRHRKLKHANETT